MRMDQVKAETGERSAAGIYAKISEGLFTKPVPIGKRAVGWPVYEVKAICAARISAKSEEEIKELVKYLHNRRAGLFEEVLSTGLPPPGGGAPCSQLNIAEAPKTRTARTRGAA